MWRHSAVLARALFSGTLALLLATCDDGPVGTSGHEGPDFSPEYGYLQVGASMTGVLLSRTATAAGIKDARGDIAWSPNGKTVAVALRGEGDLRLVDATTGVFEIRAGPLAGAVRIALTWIPGETGLYVLTTCSAGCSPAQLVPWRYHLTESSWEELHSWDTRADRADLATLEHFEADHLAVGPVNGSVLLVVLSGTEPTRALLGESDFRVSRRP